MSFALLFILCFFQQPSDPRALTGDEHFDHEVLAKQMEDMADPLAAKAAEERKKQREAAYEEQQFVNRFNHLVKMLVDFSAHYNANRTVDLKRIKALKKAWRDLEKSDAWFRIDVDQGHDHGKHENAVLQPRH